MERITFSAREALVKGYLLEDYDTLRAHKHRPALVICPGGAYRWRSPREKDSPALQYLAQGYQVFVLEYSCGAQAANYQPLRELAETVRLLRENAEQWHIDPEKITVLGFSAGGHLAASLGALWNDLALDLPKSCRPDALVLCYPVISTYDFAHEESAQWVSGGDETVRKKLHLWEQVTPSFPPTFLWHGGQDTSVPPENSLYLTVALRKAGVPVEYHLFEAGAHGISTCTQEVETPEPACAPWVELSQRWLNRRFEFNA